MIRALLDRVWLAISNVRYPPSAPKVVQTRINGYDLLALANEDVGRQIVALGRYEEHDTALLSAKIRQTDICVDIGANIGYYTVLMARRARQGRVHSFEPVPFNFQLLGASAHLNQLSNVTLNNCAVGATTGITNFSQASDGAYSSMLNIGRKPEVRSFDTQLVSLDHYVSHCGLPRVDVMKVDVEGAEALVLKGAQRLLSSPTSRPRLILLELFDRNLAAYRTSVGDVVRSLATLGYLPFCTGKGNRIRPFETHDYNRVYNVFFFRDDDSEAPH